MFAESALVLGKNSAHLGQLIFEPALKPDVELLNQLREKHGSELEYWWNKRFGFGYECLTHSEERYLLRTPSFDRIRDRIAAAVEG